MHVQSTPPVSPASGVVCGNTASRPGHQFALAHRLAQDRLRCIIELAEMVERDPDTDAVDRLRRFATCHASITFLCERLVLAVDVAWLDEPETARRAASLVESVVARLDAVAVALECLDQDGGRTPRDGPLMRVLILQLRCAELLLQERIDGRPA